MKLIYTLNFKDSSIENNDAVDKCDLNLLNNRTKFTDMNDDCKLMIFENFDLNSLLNIVEANPAFSLFAAYVFKRKFASKEIKIRQPLKTFRNVKMIDDTIEICNLGLTTKLFKYFGQHILRLRIDYETNETHDAREIIALANKYCSELTEFHLRSPVPEVLDDVEKSFENVKTLSLSGMYTKLASKSMNLTDIFPKLQNLSLEHMQVEITDSVLQHFPNLEHFRVSMGTTDCFYNRHIQPFIQMHPTIRSLTLTLASMELVKFASENLPNLENLNLDFLKEYPRMSEQFQFNSVRSLRLEASHNLIARLATFKHLQELDLILHTVISDQWIEFVKKHSNLRKLTINDYGMSQLQLSKLTGKLPDLVEASFKLEFDVTTETVIRFMEENVNLKRFHFSAFYQPQLAKMRFDTFETGIMENWNMTKTVTGNKASVTVIRKAPEQHQL